MSSGPGSSAVLPIGLLTLREGMDSLGVTRDLLLMAFLSLKKKSSLKFAGSRILTRFRESLKDGLEKLSVPHRTVFFH